MSTVLFSTIDKSIDYKTQGNVAPFEDGVGTGISFTLSSSKRENVVGTLPLSPTRFETITILSLQAASGTDGSEGIDRITSLNIYESNVDGYELLVSSNNLVKGSRSIKVGKETLPFKAYTFRFPESKQIVHGKTYLAELLLPSGETFPVDINTGVPSEGNMSKAAAIVKKTSPGYVYAKAATPLIEITGSDDVIKPTPDEDNKGPGKDPLDTSSIVYADNIRVEEAKRFVRNIKWRWDTVSERGAKPKNGFRPKMTMRRFAPGAPLNSIRIVLDMITDAAPYINPVVSGDIIQGKWKPRVTWFRKDMQQQTYDVRGDATVTIVQELVPDYEDGESDLVNAGGDCSEITEYEYVWDAAEISTPAMPYPQGVAYGVQGINRDDDSGLFSYILVKRTAVEQHFGPYISMSSAKSYATTEIYKNAYNIPADLPQEGDIVDGGKVTRVSIGVNNDCTYNIQIDRSFTSKVKAAKSCAKSVYSHQETETTTGQEKALDEAPAANGGVVKTHISTLEDDGTYTNEVRTAEEQTVQSAVKNVTVGKFITVTTTANKGQASAASISDTKDECGNITKYGIGTAKSTLTEGRLYDTEVTEYQVNKGTDTESSKIDAFSVEKTSREIGGTDYPSITDAGSYHTTEKSCSVDNTTGAITRATTVKTEVSVPDAVVVHSKSIYGVTTTKLDKNSGCGCCFTDDSYSPVESLAIGESVRVTMNPGGSADVEKSSTTVNDDGVVIASSGVKTALGKQTSYTEIKNAPFTCNLIPETDKCGKPTGAYLVCDTVSPPENGKVTNWSSKITEYGTWNTTVEVTEEKITCRSGSYTTTAFATTETTECISSTCESGSKSLGTNNEIIAVSSQLTQNGQYNNTKKTTTPVKQTWSTVNNTPFSTTTTTRFKNTSSSDDTVMVYKEIKSDDGKITYEPQKGKPKFFASECVMNEHKLYDGKIITQSPKNAVQSTQMSQDDDVRSVITKGPTGLAFSEADKFNANEGWSYTQGTQIITTRRDQDEFGNKDETVTVETPSSQCITGVSFYPTAHTVTQTYKFWNYTCAQTALTEVTEGKKDSEGNVIVKPLGIANNLRTGVSIDFNKNRFGLYNGVITITGRTGQSGSTCDGDFESTWETPSPVSCSVSHVITPRGGSNGHSVVRTVCFTYTEGTTSTFNQALCTVEGGLNITIEGFKIESIAQPYTLRGHQNKGGYYRKILSVTMEKDCELTGMNTQDRLDYAITTAKTIATSTK